MGARHRDWLHAKALQGLHILRAPGPAASTCSAAFPGLALLGAGVSPGHSAGLDVAVLTTLHPTLVKRADRPARS